MDLSTIDGLGLGLLLTLEGVEGDVGVEMDNIVEERTETFFLKEQIPPKTSDTTG